MKLKILELIKLEHKKTAIKKGKKVVNSNNLSISRLIEKRPVFLIRGK